MEILKFKRSFFWLVIILFLTFMPGNRTNNINIFNHMDKVVHFGLFLGFSLFLIFDLINFKDYKFFKKSLWVIVVSLGVFIGLITELVQHYFILSRTGSIYDFIFNVGGILAGLGGYWIFKIR